MVLELLDKCMGAEKMNPVPYFVDLSVNANTIKLLEKIQVIIFTTLGLGKVISEQIIKKALNIKLNIDNLDFPEIRKLCAY